MSRHELPALPYAFDALEPHIDARTMEIHHGKHHAAYVNNLNAALDKHPQLFELTVEELLRDLSKIPEGIRTAVRNNGGGQPRLLLAVAGRQRRRGSPVGELGGGHQAERLVRRVQGGFTAAATTRFRSGWAWLSLDAKGKLVVASTANQDTPLSRGSRQSRS
jgi:Fe-Mn family superoxide dismutase